MSDTEYTPTDADVKVAYRLAELFNPDPNQRPYDPDEVAEVDAEFTRWLAAHDAELTARVRAEQREADAQIGRDAAATWVDEWQPNSHKNSRIEDYVAAAIREAGKPVTGIETSGSTRTGEDT